MAGQEFLQFLLSEGHLQVDPTGLGWKRAEIEMEIKLGLGQRDMDQSRRETCVGNME